MDRVEEKYAGINWTLTALFNISYNCLENDTSQRFQEPPAT